MKKLHGLILFFPTILLSQEVISIPIFFEDAVGHKDTVFFGYDSLATDGLDSAFGEVNISQSPWDTTLDVRLTGVRVWQGSGQNYAYPFQTKKLIASSRCDLNASVFTVKILTRHWPVTAHWDSTLFQGVCLSTSTFASINSDAIGGSRRVTNGVNGGHLGFVQFDEESRITFTEQKYGRFEYFYEVTPDTARIDTVNLFWVSLSRSAFDRFLLSVFNTGGAKQTHFNFLHSGLVSFDLPVATRVTLTVHALSGQITEVLFDGHLPAGPHMHRMNTLGLPNGLYVYRFRIGNATESRTILHSR